MLWHAERDVRIFSGVDLAHSWSIRLTLNSLKEIRLAHIQMHISSKKPTEQVGQGDQCRSLVRRESAILTHTNQTRGGKEKERKRGRESEEEWKRKAGAEDKQVLALLYEFS